MLLNGTWCAKRSKRISYNERRCLNGQQKEGVYETNFPDHAGIINALKLAGDKDAELFIFWQPRQAQPNPNVTWGLVDKKELVDWVVMHAK